MVKKLVLLGLITLYLYFHTFGIFLTTFFIIPTPIIFGLPLIILFREDITRFLYFKEVLFLLVANLVYYFIANGDGQTFSVNMIIIIICALFFNYTIGFNKERLTTCIYVFYTLLILSTIVMFLNHLYPSQIDGFRSWLIGSEISQSPAGITSSIFNFGYQLAALVAFLFINTLTYQRNVILKVIALLFCLLSIYFGMQRSVLVTFAFSVFVFALAYYKLKALPFIFIIGVLSVFFSIFFLQENADNYDNIFAKNERNSEGDRSGLITENLKIYMDYPYGLMFHGTSWEEVTRYNKTFRGGLTSHNAYLMFFTILGPFLSIFLLTLVYYRVIVISKYCLSYITDRENAMLVCLCFSFLSASLNSLFHNSWFIGANGPLVFVFFAILHLRNQQIHFKDRALIDSPV